jgi:CHAT domain-containing protein
LSERIGLLAFFLGIIWYSDGSPNSVFVSQQPFSTLIRRNQYRRVLIYPLILNDRLEIILFSPNTLPISRKINTSKEDLQTLVTEFRVGLQDDSSEDYKETAIALYTLLIKPIETDLTKVKAKKFSMLLMDRCVISP